MTDSFDPIEYIGYLKRRWRIFAAVVGAAAGLTALVSSLLPDRFTATATLVIESPNVNDPRASTAVSSVYLESLKAYEQFAASDSLFAKACEKFGLLSGESMESFKKRVLRVTKLKDTKVLRVSVTLEDPKQAHQLARYIAEETVALNRSMAREADRELLSDLESEMGAVRARLDQARAEYNQAAAGGQERILDEELRTLADLKARTSVEWLEAKAAVAELSARREQPDLSASEARLQMLTAEQTRLDEVMTARSARLAEIRARQDRAEEALRVAEAGFDAWSRRTTELAAATGSRAEQLRVVDPGIVPQRPSFPNLPLFVIAAAMISAVMCIGILTLRFGLERVRASTADIPTPSQIRVARGGRG